MGPALRPTPLSPACGSRRGRLTPGAFNAASNLFRRTWPYAASLSPGARAGAGPVGGWSQIARTDSVPPGGSATGFVRPCLKRFRIVRRRYGTSAWTSKVRPSDFAPSRYQRSGLVCILGEPWSFPHLVLLRAAFRRRVDPVPKSLLRRWPFGLCLGRANPRLDDWKVRAATDSGKRGTVQLSTFGQNASGQHWITQRFTAK
jgi:hypothetical protein